MVDVVDPATRSRMMSGIRGTNTTPELLTRKFLHSHGFRFRLHVKGLPGKPDIVLPKYRTVIFVHGCFWHQHPGCKDSVMPKSNTKFWTEKLVGNTRRDAKNIFELAKLGWQCLIVWECEVDNSKGQKQLISKLREK